MNRLNKKLGRPPKRERNRDLVFKRLDDPEEWTYKKLSDHFNMGRDWVSRIFHRDINKYGSKERIRAYIKLAKEKGWKYSDDWLND